MISLEIKKALESGLHPFLTEVGTHALLLSTHVAPTEPSKCVVTVDETRDDKRTMYVWETTTWEYVGVVAELPAELIFTDSRNVYISDKDRKPIKIGDVLPYTDLNALKAANPALKGKFYQLDNGKFYIYDTLSHNYIPLSTGDANPNFLADVATKALITTTHTSPLPNDAVKVLADETVDGQPTWYLHDGMNWNYQGIYFVEDLITVLSDVNTRAEDIVALADYILPFKYLVNHNHLDVYLEDEILIKGVDYTEVGTADYVSETIKFTNTIPKQAKLIFRRNIATPADDAVLSRMSKDVLTKYATEAGYTLVKTKVFTGTSPAVGANSVIPHGLDVSKIISVSAFITNGSNYIIPAHHGTDVGAQDRFDIAHTTTNIDLRIETTGASVANRPYKIVVQYTD